MGGDFHILAETHEMGKAYNNAMLEFPKMIHAPLRNGAYFFGYKDSTW